MDKKDDKKALSEKDSKATSATAVNASTEVEDQAVVANAQNQLGAASSGTHSAAMASMSSTNNTSSAVTASRTDTSQGYSRFMNGVQQCRETYANLGTWLNDQICDFVGAVDIPAMFKKFQELDKWKQVLIAIAILGLIGLIGWMSWEGVAYAWPHIMSFLNSPTAQSYLEKAGVLLQAVADSAVMQRFIGTLTSASSVAVTDANADPPCFEEADWTMLTSMAVMSSLDVINTFFAYMSKSAMPPK